MKKKQVPYFTQQDSNLIWAECMHYYHLYEDASYLKLIISIYYFYLGIISTTAISLF